MLITVGVLGLLAALDPLRPVVFVLVLTTEGARVNAIALLIGWAASLTALFSIGFILAGAGVTGTASSGTKSWVSALELVAALVLLVLAARRWQHRNDPTTASLAPDAVIRRLDNLHPRSVGLMGVLIQPRTMTIAAALVVARERSSFFGLLVGFGDFAIFSTVVLISILLYDLWRHDTAQDRLKRLVSRLEAYGATICTVLIALAGAYLIIDGIRGLASE